MIRIPRQEVFGCDVFQQEAARSGDERVEDVLVEVEGGEHQHAWGIFGGHDLACRLEAVHDGHPDVH